MLEGKELIATNLFAPTEQVVTKVGERLKQLSEDQVLPEPRNLLSLGAALLPPLLAGGLGTIATNASVSTWYRTLKKPPWNPPNWIFGPVWTVLYVVMGLASWLIWRERRANEQAANDALKWYSLQLGLNAFWSFAFFGMRRVGLALIDIAALWAALLTCLIKFKHLRPVAGWLLLPYFLWVSFASTLNAAIWWLNRSK